jgi:L-asparaginase/Glu-tRNA(Gln) amidotransferase subunit D
MATDLPRIVVIGTGGTISSLGASSLDVLDYPDFGQKLSCEALLDRFPERRGSSPTHYASIGNTARPAASG